MYATVQITHIFLIRNNSISSIRRKDFAFIITWQLLGVPYADQYLYDTIRVSKYFIAMKCPKYYTMIII